MTPIQKARRGKGAASYLIAAVVAAAFVVAAFAFSSGPDSYAVLGLKSRLSGIFCMLSGQKDCPSAAAMGTISKVFSKKDAMTIRLDGGKTIYFPLNQKGFIEVPLSDGTVFRVPVEPGAEHPPMDKFEKYTGSIEIKNSVIIHKYGLERVIIVPNNPLDPVGVPMEGGGNFMVIFRDPATGKASVHYDMQGNLTVGSGNIIYSFKKNCYVKPPEFSAHWLEFGVHVDNLVNSRCQ